MKRFKTILYWSLVILLVVFTFARCFDNVLWGDEAFSAYLARSSFQDIVQITAKDVHPPLYYFMTKIFVMIFGESGFILHFVSFIPYLAIIIISCTLIRKKYGRMSSLLLCLLMTTSPLFVQYNIEVRMYSLATLLVFMVALIATKCFEEGTYRQYFLLALFTALASYTHYYCIVMCGLIYVFLLIANVVKKKKKFRVIISGMIASIMYIPWMFILFSTFGRASNNWWANSIPNAISTMEFPFASNFIFSVIMIVYIMVILLYTAKVLKRKKFLHYELDFSKFELNSETFMVLMSMIVYFGTAAVGIAVSKIFRPLFLLRYLIPAVILIYAVVATGINKFKNKMIHGVAICILMMLFMSLPTVKIVLRDIINAQKTDYTVGVLDEKMPSNAVILTDSTMLNWTVLEYHFRGMNHRMITADEFKNFVCKSGEKYVIMWSGDIPEGTEQNLEKNGCKTEKILEKEQSSLGTVKFNGYILEGMESN